MKRALVTGSAGFVGKHLVAALEERGVGVEGYDKRLGQDLSVPDAQDRLLGGAGDVDIVFHLAASCSTPGSIGDPLGTFYDTVITTGNVLEFARVRDIPVIVTSSVKARDAMTPYGAAKKMVETWSAEIGATYRFPVVINRPGTIYGPGQEGSPESGWIAWFLRARDEGIKVTINGDGTQTRDLLHVSDYVELMLLQAERPSFYSNRIWDVGGGHRNIVTVIDMAQWLGLDYELGPKRYGDSHSYVGVNAVPGWEPKVFWKEAEVFRDL